MDFEYQEVYIKNSRGVQLFTCRWLPASSSPKALVFLCHGYGMECSVYMKECGIRLARARYAVFGIDYEGHGRSSGSRCYIKKFENIVNDCNEFFKSVCEKDYSNKGRFLYGESMGGAVALLLHKKEPSFYNGAVLVAPMCKISEKLKPHPVVVNILTSFEEIIPKWKIVPTKDVINAAFKDPVKREEVRLPFLVLHGDADTVTDPEISKALYEQASSKDKTMKLYSGMWHGLTAGETNENVDIVFADIIDWLDKHTHDLIPEPIIEPFNNGIERLDEFPTAVSSKQSQRKQSYGIYLCGFREPRTLHSAM
ncbi:caffeoylshikimate esterase isoform X3 [Hevea brasiliensis]|uniref:caffeoylshikimate esterase isoform X3 n=1 Tax=Hevea brasiliensis TaxID=3981 RepID=UPI00260022A3|nr:caffeoylshikimate esterase isoform X3 [Hevea brasiliensis]